MLDHRSQYENYGDEDKAKGNKGQRVMNTVSEDSERTVKETSIPNEKPTEEKYYFINHDFKKQLKEQSEFSLLKRFDDSKELAEQKDENWQNKSVSFESGYIRKPPDYNANKAGKSKHNEEGPPSNGQHETSSRDSQGWWLTEPLFFKHDDPRFEGAIGFVKYINRDYGKTFSTLRKQIKEVVRSKAQKAQDTRKRPTPKSEHVQNKKKYRRKH